MEICEIKGDMQFLYTCADKCQSVSIGIGFKLNIPKEANILSAKFTYWTSTLRKAPTYKVHIYSVTPRSLSSYLDDSKYKDDDEYSNTPQVKWNIMDVGSQDLPIDTEITTGNILQGLVQDFVNHISYTPDTYFQLLFLNSNLDRSEPSHADRIICHGYDTDLDKRAGLTIEWTL